MTAGRKPTPDHLKLVKAGETLPSVQDDDALADNPPQFLNARAQYHWRDIVRSSPAGMLHRLDSGVLGGYCQALALYEQACEKVQKQGAIVKTKNQQPMKNPYLSIADQQVALLVKLGSELGFSPSSRSRVQPSKRKRGRSPLGKLKDFKV